MPTLFLRPVNYFLENNNERISFNELLNHTITIQWTGNIFCILCGQKTPKTYGEGMCYKCFATAPENSECIIHPELCKAHLHEGRDPEWEEKNHNKPHFVYLAYTSEVKVGVTRATQIPTRWIDQGATAAILLAETPYRQKAGEIEVFLKNYFPDKTRWDAMLQNQQNGSALILSAKEKALKVLPPEFMKYIYNSDELIELEYPVQNYPIKVNAINLTQVQAFKLPLTGIKGQYLYFDSDKVFNVRRHSGYEVEIMW
ncbi:MAG: DUF2797 domain-containing protein [Chitinophagales bacterium]|nr:DUF2797 domain-containing protein [Chitinophagales bacterium]